MNWYKRAKIELMKLAARPQKVLAIAGITGMAGNNIESISDYVQESDFPSAHERIAEENGALGRHLYNDTSACHWYFDIPNKKLLWYVSPPSSFIKGEIKGYIRRKYKMNVESEGFKVS